MQLYLIRYLQNNLITLMLTLCWHFCNREGKLLRKLKTKILGGTTMKKFSTRLIALVMALTLVMSCGVFASAAEAEAVPENNVVRSVNDEEIGGCDLPHVYTGASVGGRCSLPNDGYLIWKFAVVGTCRLTLTATLPSGKVLNYVNEVYKNQSISKISTDILPIGTVINYTLTAEGEVEAAALAVLWKSK